MNAVRIVALVLVAALVAAGPSAGGSESKAGEDKSRMQGFGEHQSYGSIHAAINRSALQQADKSRLHEVVGHVADMEIRERQAAALRRDYDRETNSERKLALEKEIERQEALYKSAQTDASSKLQEVEEASQGTDVGNSISNFISQVVSMINNAVRG